MSNIVALSLSLSVFLLFVTKTTASRKIFKVKSPRRQRRRRTSWVLYAKRGPYQCDQIVLISKGYSDNFSYKSSPNFGQLFRPTWKGSLFKWTLLLILFVGNFLKKWMLLTITFGHTWPYQWSKSLTRPFAGQTRRQRLWHWTWAQFIKTFILEAKYLRFILAFCRFRFWLVVLSQRTLTYFVRGSITVWLTSGRLVRIQLLCLCWIR